MLSHRNRALTTAAALMLATAPGLARAADPAPTGAVLSPAEINAIVTAPLPADQAAMKAHVMFLAADALKGRDASSPEYAIAAQYVAAQFYAAGLKPAGDDGGYLQRVPLVAYKPADNGSFALTAPGKPAVALDYGVDYVPSANPAAKETRVDAPIVFVGHGIVAPDYGRNDYAGVDVRGKIVAFFGGAPKGFNSEVRAHFLNPATKAATAAQHGAVGVIQLESMARPARGTFSFALAKAGAARERTTWETSDGTGAPALDSAPVLATFSLAGAAKLFAGTGQTWAKIARRSADDNAVFRAKPLAVTLKAVTRTSFVATSSSNIIGVIPGSDPVVGKEIVVLSAHLDHIGVGKGTTGDQINNGAEDNAVGIASLIEEAKRFAASGTPPRRTIMFLAVTAEEKGLVGSDFYARNPTVPRDHIVANVDLDMPILTYPFEDVIAFGADRSTLGPIVRRAVAGMGLVVSPDPIPDEAIFVRSDHYRFVQQGVPAVFLWPGQMGPGKAATEDFLARHYHRPSDDLSLPIDWSQGVRFVDANYRISRAIADAPDRPRWNKGDFFGTLYHGLGAQ
ncbi:MAG: M28 family peptidase [Sphingomonas sp.]|nr:M28 family peptidase [Sphingomonas sp.]